MHDPSPAERRSTPITESTSFLIVARVAIVVAVAGALEVITRLELLPANFVARPTDIASRIGEGVRSGEMQSAVGETLVEVLAALGLASVIGLSAGYVLWRSRLLSRALLPIVNALFSSPIVLLYPVSLVLFGRTQTAIIVQATAYATLPIVVYTARALAEIPRVLQKVADVELLTSWQRLTKVMIPSAAPKLSTGVRLGVTYIMISVVSVEFLVQIGGLGSEIQLSALRFDMPGVYAYVLAVVLLSALLISGVHAIERKVQQ